jgi:hypothetical protein
MAIRALLAVIAVVGCCGSAAGQDVFRDYFANAPRCYGPADPWTTGAVYGKHIGHSGHFYNCDHQEEKRWSPYISWQCQKPVCRRSHPILSDIRQQICEVRQRIRWGKGCDIPCYDPLWQANVMPQAMQGVAPEFETAEPAPPLEPDFFFPVGGLFRMGRDGGPWAAPVRTASQPGTDSSAVR